MLTLKNSAVAVSSLALVAAAGATSPSIHPGGKAAEAAVTSENARFARVNAELALARKAASVKLAADFKAAQAAPARSRAKLSLEAQSRYAAELTRIVKAEAENRRIHDAILLQYAVRRPGEIRRPIVINDGRYHILPYPYPPVAPKPPVVPPTKPVVIPPVVVPPVIAPPVALAPPSGESPARGREVR